jgi:disulfide bond formation protein DsbB
MFRNPDLFNPECFKQAFAMANMTDPMILGLAMPQFISRLIIGLTIFGFVVDAITTLVRVIRKAVNV